MINKILIPVDGSPQSVRAVELASDLAEKYGAEVILLHVLLRGHMPSGLKRALEIEVGKKLRKANNLVNLPQEILARVDTPGQPQFTIEELDVIGKYVLSNVEAVCKAKGVPKVKKQVEEGNPAKVIIEQAKRQGVDMIVMGSSGLSDLKGLLIGSVSHKVMQLAECTCVSVK